MTEQLAIMKSVGFGCRDVGRPCLFFETFVSECGAALQILYGEDALKFIEDYGVYDVSELEGKPVWVDVKGNMIQDPQPCLLVGSKK